jgi:acyl-CoA thioesterase FadM
MEAGFGLVARRYRIEYKQPAVFGDEPEIATWASDMKRATAVRHYTIRRAADGELLFEQPFSPISSTEPVLGIGNA